MSAGRGRASGRPGRDWQEVQPGHCRAEGSPRGCGLTKGAIVSMLTFVGQIPDAARSEMPPPRADAAWGTSRLEAWR